MEQEQDNSSSVWEVPPRPGRQVVVCTRLHDRAFLKQLVHSFRGQIAFLSQGGTDRLRNAFKPGIGERRSRKLDDISFFVRRTIIPMNDQDMLEFIHRSWGSCSHRFLRIHPGRICVFATTSPSRRFVPCSTTVMFLPTHPQASTSILAPEIDCRHWYGS